MSRSFFPTCSSQKVWPPLACSILRQGRDFFFGEKSGLKLACLGLKLTLCLHFSRRGMEEMRKELDDWRAGELKRVTNDQAAKLREARAEVERHAREAAARAEDVAAASE
jgi:hypothetical protein